MAKEKDIKWVALHDLPGKVYADMVMEVLRQHNIPCLLKSLYGSGGVGVVSGAGLVGSRDRIMVPEEYLEQASQILNEMLDHL